MLLQCCRSTGCKSAYSCGNQKACGNILCLAGASEACVDAVSIGGFSRMRALETRFNDRPSASSRPFDADRGGFVISEGAGIVVLEDMGHAAARGATIIAEVLC